MSSLKFFLAPFVALLCISNSLAQQTSEEFLSGKGRFALRAGGLPTGIRSTNSQLPKYWMPGDTFIWQSDESYTSVTHHTPIQIDSTSGRSLSAAAKQEILLAIRAIFKADFEKASALVQEAPFGVQGFKGVEFRVAGETRSLVRIFFINNRLYSLIAMRRGISDFETQKKLLDTFRFLENDEFSAAMLRDFAPAELPQTIPNGIVPTDSIEFGLKGRIQEIVEEKESGTPVKLQRSEEEHFNDLGFLTKKVTYANGFPDVVTLYGWVDGNRAANVGPISYLGDKKGIGTSKMTVGWGAPQGENVIGRDYTGQIVDRRYTTRFETKYDDKWRISERRYLSSSGDVSHVEKFTYIAIGRDVKTEDGIGGFIGRTFEVIDKDGNVTELRTLDNNGRTVGTLTYQYEFDPKGNWIVKKAYRKATVGKPALKPIAVFYRKIKYYE